MAWAFSRLSNSRAAPMLLLVLGVVAVACGVGFVGNVSSMARAAVGSSSLAFGAAASLRATFLRPPQTLDEALDAARIPTCVDVMRAPPHKYKEQMVLYRPRQASVFVRTSDGGRVDLVAKAVAPETLVLPEAARRLMVVAHADDELLFGGTDLLAGPPGSWVVLVANRVGPRVHILPNVTAYFQLAALVTFEHFEKWELEYYDTAFVRDLHGFLRRRSWDVVVTHQLPGEYGNTQHRALHVVVSALVAQPDVHTADFRVFQFHPRSTPPPALRASEAVYANLTSALEMYGERVVKSFAAKIRMSGPSVAVPPSGLMSPGNLTQVVCAPLTPAPVASTVAPGPATTPRPS